MDWSLLGCGANGHVTFAPDQPQLRERLSIITRDGAAWRCLRCGTFVIGEPTTSGPVSAAPRVRRGKELRSALILRLFAIERFVRAIVFGLLAYGIWRFKSSQLTIDQAFNRELPELRELLRQLGFNVNHSKLLGLIQHALTLNPGTPESTIEPVIRLAASDARKCTTEAISSGCPTRPMGVISSQVLYISGLSLMPKAVSGVSI